MKKKKLISVITPCFNEGSAVETCFLKIGEVFKKHLPDYDYEHIFCDNASTDDTLDILKKLANKHKQLKVIVNARNFGILKNTYNGVLNSSGDATILFMPVDMQDPPELIPTFVEEWEKGHEVVYGIREQREEFFVTAKLRKLYYRFLSKITYVDYPKNVGDYQLVDRVVLDNLKKYSDAQPFMRLMIFDIGFKSIGIPYKWKAREVGISQNGFLKMIDQGLNGIISFSVAPLRLAMILGLLVSIGSLAYALSLFIYFLFSDSDVLDGVPTLIVGLFFFGGVQLFFLGILGEYISAIYNQVRQKPLVIERERINFD